MTKPDYTDDDVRTATDAALTSGLMSGNDEFRPTSYAVNAEWVAELARVVVAAVAPGIAERARS